MKYLKMLPSNWSQVTVKDYLRFIELLEFEETDGMLIVEAAFFTFTGFNLSDVNVKPDEVDAIVKRLTFIGEFPKEPETALKFKSMNELSYQEYITFQKLIQGNYVANLHHIAKIFVKGEINEDTISVNDAMACFFLLNQKMNKRLKYSALSLNLKLMKWKLVTYLQKMLQWFGMKDKTNGVGF
ncbi:hypothetical protein [Pedobacter sp. CFBP9032]|uniref:hypothetical protein n=1 Tax=Pedobacter sp. CFBP9032 TaxID=3096539 RepID=UPI002A6B6598|nr:hypothetical protein [Pedobacter sp. CFBP9032]MDY0906581.1 hypothetical protein [Pedobacter sp. CFBP9032]